MDSKNVIGIQFGVLGGASITGDSGRLIKDQLEQIAAQINLRVKVGVDEKFFNDQIDKLAVSLNQKLGQIKISPIAGASARAGSADAGNSVSASASTSKESSKYDELRAKLEELYKAHQKFDAARDTGTQRYFALQTRANQLQQEYNNAKNAAGNGVSADEINNLNKREDALKETRQAQQELNEAVDRDNMAGRMQTSFNGLLANAEALIERYSDLIAHNKEAARSAEQLQKFIDAPYKGADHIGPNGSVIAADFTAAKRQAAEFAQTLKHTSGEMSRLAVESDTFGSKLRKALDSKFFARIAVALIAIVTRALKQVYDNVVKIDTAMTQLRIVTRSSEKSYSEFADAVAKSAKKIGSTVTDLIESTIVFARLGYSLKDSQLFAELTTMYSKVSNLNINETTANITAIIKAFKIGARDLESVIDQLVYVGNKYAISSAEIGIAMNNAASSLAANGNTLQQAIGILTAANTTLQNVNTSSTAVRTIAARISNSKADLMAMGETTDELGSSTAIMRDRLLALTGVDINDANGKLRSTYDILSDLAKAWDAVAEAGNTAAVATLMAGTRQQNAFYSIMQNWQDAESIVANAEDGYNNLGRAQAEYIDSVAGKLEQLKAGWEEFSTAILDSELIKGAITFLSGIVSALSWIAKLGDGLIITIPMITLALVALWAILIKIKTTAVFGTITTALKGLLAIFPAIILSLKAMYLRHMANVAATKMHTNAVMLNIAATKAADAAQKAMAASNPFGWIMLIIGLLVLLISKLGLFEDKMKKLRETAKETKEAWEENKTKLEEVNTQLKETAERIKELEEIKERRPLNFVEQDELDRLNDLTAELLALHNSLEFSTELSRQKAESAAIAVVNARESKRYKKEALKRKDTTIKDENGTKIYINNAADDYNPEMADAETARIIMDNWSRASENQKAFVDKIIDEYREQSKQIQYYANASTKAQLDANAAYLQIFETIDRYNIASGLSFQDTWKSLLGRQNFKGSTDALKELADAGEVTADSLKELYGANKNVEEFINYLVKLGKFSWDCAESIDALVVSVNELWQSKLFSVSELTHLDIIEETASGFDTLSKALDDINKLGVVSASNLKDLLGHYDGIERFFQKSDQGFVLADPDMTSYEVLTRFATESLQKYVDRLEIAKIQLKKVEEAQDGSARQAEELRKAQEYAAAATENLSTATATWAIHLRSLAIKEKTDELNSQKNALKEQLDGYKSLIDVRKDLLKTYKKEIDYQKELSKRQKNLVDLQTQLALAKMDTSAAGQARVRELESQLQTAKEELDAFTLEHAIDVLTTYLDNEYNEYKSFIETQTSAIVEAIDNLARDLQLNTQELVPQVTENLWENTLKGQLSAAEGARNKANDEYKAAKKNVDDAGNALAAAQTERSNISGWDKFWNTGKFKTAKANLAAAEGVLYNAESNLTAAETALSSAQKEVDRIKAELAKIGVYHTGGFVGGSAMLKPNEEYAKLMKGELVITPQQMKNFMGKTFPSIAGGGAGAVQNYNAPLIQIHCDSITKDSLPDLQKIVDRAVNSIKREFDSGMSRTGFKRGVNKFTANQF